MKKRPRLVIRSLDELPPGFVPMSKWLENGQTTAAYSVLRQAVRMGRLAAAKLHPNGRETFRGRVYVDEAEALALVAVAEPHPARQPPAPGPLFARLPEPTPLEHGAAELAGLAERIAAARTVADLGAAGDEAERLESAGTLTPEECAALMGAINRRHADLEPVAAVAASLATGDPGTVDRLATAMERVAEALEELLRRSRLEIDLDPCA